jgi:hypothetical protein
MSKGSYSFVLALLAVVTCTNGFAQKLEVGAFGGASLWSRPSFSIPSAEPPGRTDIDYRFADGGLFGLRVREHLTQYIGLEQSWMISGTNNIERNGLSVGPQVAPALLQRKCLRVLQREESPPLSFDRCRLEFLPPHR